MQKAMDDIAGTLTEIFNHAGCCICNPDEEPGHNGNPTCLEGIGALVFT